MAHFRENPSERSARGPWNRTKFSVRFRLAGSSLPMWPCASAVWDCRTPHQLLLFLSLLQLCHHFRDRRALQRRFRRYPDKSAKDNSANDTSAKPTVRMPTVRKGQQCECQQCECDNGANVSSANATAVRKTILRTVQNLSVSLFFFLQKLLLLFTSIFDLKMPITARFSIYQEM